MLVAKLFSKIYKKGGIILIDHSGQKFICGNPDFEKPLTLKIIEKKIKYTTINKSRPLFSRSLYER